MCRRVRAPLNAPTCLLQNVNVCHVGQGNDRLKSTTSDANLQRVCGGLELQRFLNNDPSRRGDISEETMATLIEAIIEAVAEDGGLRAVRSVMETLGLLAPHQHE
jgi:dsRNA-specific ribonuclease